MSVSVFVVFLRSLTTESKEEGGRREIVLVGVVVFFFFSLWNWSMDLSLIDASLILYSSGCLGSALHCRCRWLMRIFLFSSLFTACSEILPYRKASLLSDYSLVSLGGHLPMSKLRSLLEYPRPDLSHLLSIDIAYFSALSSWGCHLLGIQSIFCCC